MVDTNFDFREILNGWFAFNIKNIFLKEVMDIGINFISNNFIFHWWFNLTECEAKDLKLINSWDI